MNEILMLLEDLHIHRLRRDDHMSSVRPIQTLEQELAQIQKVGFPFKRFLPT